MAEAVPGPGQVGPSSQAAATSPSASASGLTRRLTTRPCRGRRRHRCPPGRSSAVRPTSGAGRSPRPPSPNLRGWALSAAQAFPTPCRPPRLSKRHGGSARRHRPRRARHLSTTTPRACHSRHGRRSRQGRIPHSRHQPPAKQGPAGNCSGHCSSRSTAPALLHGMPSLRHPNRGCGRFRCGRGGSSPGWSGCTPRVQVVGSPLSARIGSLLEGKLPSARSGLPTRMWCPRSAGEAKVASGPTAHSMRPEAGGRSSRCSSSPQPPRKDKRARKIKKMSSKLERWRTCKASRHSSCQAVSQDSLVVSWASSCRSNGLCTLLLE